VDHAGLGFHFAHGNDRRFDLSYNHYRPSAANGAGSHMVDAGLIWPLSLRWQGLLAWDYDVEIKSTEKYMAGVKYESCCWAIRVFASGHLVRQAVDNSRQYDKMVYVQFLLKGLGSIGGGAPSAEIQAHNPGYQDPFSVAMQGAH